MKQVIQQQKIDKRSRRTSAGSGGGPLAHRGAQRTSRRGGSPQTRGKQQFERSATTSLSRQQIRRPGSRNDHGRSGNGGARGTTSSRGPAGGIGSLFRRISLPDLGGLTAAPNGLGSALGRLVDQQTNLGNLPLLVAAFCALFVLNTMMDSPGGIARYALPAPKLVLPVSESSRVLWNSMEPAQNYDVIGESITVDPTRFSRLEVQAYTLVAGDTLSGIANRFDLRMDTLVSFNQIQDVRRLQVGTTFRIPNRDGLLHKVQRGDSVSGIAAEYGSSVNALLDANDMASSTIAVGDVLFVPEAKMNQTELKLILGELFVYPVRGRFTSGFGMRNDPFTGQRRFHNGIDLAGPIGTPIGAAMPGTVAHIETQIGNYGKFVILRHDGGFQTLYAHLDDFSVRKGQYVSQGQTVGIMGNTGRSTGPHLHFSIIRNGSFVDPLGFLH